MASQNEMHPGTGNEPDSKSNENDSTAKSLPVVVETKEQPAPPFSEFDPWRAHRYREVSSETSDFLDSMGLKSVGIESADEDQLRTLSKDAEERQGWSQTRSDAFRGIIRLGAILPPRGNRIL